jgi:hypothetical protein
MVDPEPRPALTAIPKTVSVPDNPAKAEWRLLDGIKEAR